MEVFDTESEKDEVNNECPICKETIESVAILQSCNHKFCKRCTSKWLSMKRTCPLCRTQTLLYFCNIHSDQNYDIVHAGTWKDPHFDNFIVDLVDIAKENSCIFEKYIYALFCKIKYDVFDLEVQKLFQQFIKHSGILNFLECYYFNLLNYLGPGKDSESPIYIPKYKALLLKNILNTIGLFEVEFMVMAMYSFKEYWVYFIVGLWVSLIDLYARHCETPRQKRRDYTYFLFSQLKYKRMVKIHKPQNIPQLVAIIEGIEAEMKNFDWKIGNLSCFFPFIDMGEGEYRVLPIENFYKSSLEDIGEDSMYIGEDIKHKCKLVKEVWPK